MIQAALARRYAKALLAIALEDRQVEKLDEELDSFRRAVGATPDLKALVADPTVPPEPRTAALAEIAKRLGLSETVRSFVLLLAAKGRLAAIDAIHHEFRRMADEKAGKARALVTSAVPIAKEAEAALKARLGEVTGRKVEVTVAVDPELLGGIVAEIDGVVWDGSLRTQLRRIRDSARGP